MDGEVTCRAEEWQRDVRGWWAMRACIRQARHTDAHRYGSWQPHPIPPCTDLRATVFAQPAPTDESLRALAEHWAESEPVVVRAGDKGHEAEVRWLLSFARSVCAALQRGQEGR